MEPAKNDSRLCLGCVLILLPVLGIILSLTGIFPALKFSEEGWTAIPKAIGYLGVLALLIERLIEIILSPCRAPGSKALKQEVEAAREKAASLATTADPAATNTARETVKVKEADLTHYTSITQRWALFIGFGIALAATSAGVRLIEPLFDTVQLEPRAKAYRDADARVSRARKEEALKSEAYQAAWSSTQAGLTTANLLLIISNRVSEMTGQAMAEFSTRLSPASALSNAALAKMAWEAASTNTATMVAGHGALREERSSHLQLWWLRLIDVLLTAAALTGGTQPLHELLAWWSQANEKRKKNP